MFPDEDQYSPLSSFGKKMRILCLYPIVGKGTFSLSIFKVWIECQAYTMHYIKCRTRWSPYPGHLYFKCHFPKQCPKRKITSPACSLGFHPILLHFPSTHSPWHLPTPDAFHTKPETWESNILKHYCYFLLFCTFKSRVFLTKYFLSISPNWITI